MRMSSWFFGADVAYSVYVLQMFSKYYAVNCLVHTPISNPPQRS